MLIFFAVFGVVFFLLLFSFVFFAVGYAVASDDAKDRLTGAKPVDDWWRKRGMKDFVR